MILKGLKKKPVNAKGLWEELFHEVLWQYHTTHQSTTKEIPFTMVYGADIMLFIDINMPSWRHSQFDQDVNKPGFEYVTHLVD